MAEDEEMGDLMAELTDFGKEKLREREEVLRGEVSPEPETVTYCSECGQIDYKRCGPPTGVFGVDPTVHHYRHPESQSAIDRLFHALVNGQDLDMAPWGLGQQQMAIAKVIIELADFLLTKNRKYGGAALTQSKDRVFARDLTPGDLILVRLDDKLARIRAGAADDEEDPYWDMLGYLVLLAAGKQLEATNWDGS